MTRARLLSMVVAERAQLQLLANMLQTIDAQIAVGKPHVARLKIDEALQAHRRRLHERPAIPNRI